METRPTYVDSLLQPDAYAHQGFRPTVVELVETHVSYLFLTGELVFKVKKPVDFGFLDFTAPDTRRYFCEEEVRLNRRFSPDVYLGVVPVTQGQGGFALGGPGDIVDYAVKMRQLPREQMLDARLRAGTVSRDDVAQVARRVAQAHAVAERPLAPSENGGWRSMCEHVEENIAQTQAAVPELASSARLEDVAAFSRAFLNVHESLFHEREQAGRIVDGHGDLHAGQICLNNGIEFIDCLEFSPSYRCGDTAADIAFLAMDLDHFGRPDLSRAFADAYVEESGDGDIHRLLPFYKCYRAHVRAKVAWFKLQSAALVEPERDVVMNESRSYFALAHTYALDALKPPLLIVVMGLPGTGKSTIARALAERWSIRTYSSDVERKRMLGMDPTDRATAAPGKGIYRPGIGRRTYMRLFDLAEEDLQAGRSVVLDATFGHRPYRQQAVRLAERTGASVWFGECVLPRDEVHRRIRARTMEGRDPSDADVDVYERQLRAWLPVGQEHGAAYLRIMTNAPLDEAVERLVHELFRRSL